MRAEQLTPAAAHHGEGPVWLAEGASGGWPHGLSWVDMLAGDVLSLDADGTVARRHVSSVVAVVRPRTRGGLVYAVERGFAVDDGPGTPVRELPPVDDRSEVRMNEGGCDPAGNLYCGSMGWEKQEGIGRFWRLDVNGTVHLVGPDMTIPNGLEWTPDGTRAYHDMTLEHRIDVLDWDAERGLHHRRPFVRVEDAGGPDGLTVDAEGGVWCAVWGAGAVHRYDADGTLSAVVEVPASQVSACVFGGPDLDRLFITTSRDEMSDPEPEAGALFVVEPGVRGQAVRPFGG